MHLFHGRHPEIRMQRQLVKKPGRSAFLSPDAQEIRLCPVGLEPVPVLMLAVAGATIE
jgi:hypothetical protein